MFALSSTIPSASPLDRSRGLFGNRYEILSLLAKGGQGTVHIAEDLQTKRRVALKLVDPGDDEMKDSHGRLMLEAQIGSRLACKHIADVLDAGMDSKTGLSFLTMELFEGSDLQRLVERDGPLPPTLVVEYLRQVAIGLNRAHSYKDAEIGPTPIVHRDLKPANLFLSTREDRPAIVIILDFGVAKILERHAQVSIRLRGTPLYMAPEQLACAPVSPAADIWALGLIAFFLLTSRPYWIAGQPKDCNLQRLFREVAAGAIEPPSRRVAAWKLNLELPKTFDGWFLCCVHRRPERRFAAAGIAVEELAKALRVPWVPTPSSTPNMPGCHVCHQPRNSKRMEVSREYRRLLWFGLGAALGFAAVLCTAAAGLRLEAEMGGLKLGAAGVAHHPDRQCWSCHRVPHATIQ